MKTEKFEIIAKTFQGLETVLAEEVQQLGGKNIQEIKRGVMFEGDLPIIYKSNLWLRTALRILVPIARFQANDAETLYKGVKKIEWSSYFNNNQTFAIESSINSEYFNNSVFTSLKVKDAIADYFREKTGNRPNVDTKNPEIRINLHLFDDRCTISIDSSGEPLFKRDYREETLSAPLNEALAAGLVLLSGWDKQSIFIDPMCGSGTLPIEAAMIALGVAPNKNRKKYAFQNWKNYQSDLWNEIYQKGSIPTNTEKIPQIIGSDGYGKAVSISRANAKSADVLEYIKFFCKDFVDYQEQIKPSTLIMNPPYGERLKTEEINSLYKKLGDTLKKNFSGSKAWILSSNMEAIKYIGLKPKSKKSLYNGALDCKFLSFELYQGSRKEKKQNFNIE